MPSANYVWPQLLNKYARKVIEANGGEVVFEEYYPLDQAEYSATISKIKQAKADCVFNTVIPPGLQPFVKQLHESGFQKNGGVLCAVFYDENLLNYHPPAELDGLISCLDYYQSVDDPFSKSLQEAYARKFPGTKYPFTAGTGGTGMYRGVKFYEAAVKETGGKLDREEVAAALDHTVLRDGPGGGAEIVPGHYHKRMNMYIAVCKNDAGKAHYEVIDRATMVDPKEC
jgi:urea transport system substrate-binding protein